MRILFPEQYDPKDFCSLGRNGCMYTSGVNLISGMNSLYIEPINSKGSIGQGNVHVPKDREFLLSLASALTRAANEEDL